MKVVRAVLMVMLVVALLVPFACIRAYRWVSLHLVHHGDRRAQDRADAGY
jgi:hypothetical protein